MKTTIEEINGKKCTVIRKPFDAEYVKAQLDIGEMVTIRKDDPNSLKIMRTTFLRHAVDDELSALVVSHGNTWMVSGMPFAFFHDWEIEEKLPALPRNPKPEDARLLYRYMAEGIVIYGDSQVSGEGCINHKYEGYENSRPNEITHAINSETGEKIEVAINE